MCSDMDDRLENFMMGEGRVGCAQFWNTRDDFRVLFEQSDF